jgi:tetratricopeptide (TPR) repeat protein
MIDPLPLWDFDDPAASEMRFGEAAAGATDPDDEAVLRTQVARSLGLQEKYDEGHAVLDGLTSTTPEGQVRIALERGRLLRSSGSDGARPRFEEAAGLAAGAGLDALRIDALHMVALVADPADQLAINEQALTIARHSSDQQARDWDASLLNNIGMVHADADDLPAALGSFEEALAARERVGDPSRTRIARWMVAWTLRRLGRTDEALAMQRALKAELETAGEADPYVDEELALLEAR